MTFNLFHFHRTRAAFFHDLVMAALSFPLALYLRVGDGFAAYFPETVALGMIVLTLVCTVVFSRTGMYRGVWRYASLNDMLAIAKGATFAVLLLMLVMFLMIRLEHIPRSLFVINWFVLISLLAGPRFFYRAFKDRRLEFILAKEDFRRIPVLLVGAGDEAELFLREVNRNTAGNYRVVGLVAEKASRVGRHIHGVEVLGLIEELPQVVADLKRLNQSPQRLVITKDNLDGALIRPLLDQAESLGLTLSRLPKLTDLKSGMADALEIKPISIEDLLGRPQTVLDRKAMAAMVENKRVLVTGAGGTIGGELVRQIAAFRPAEIILLDHGEFQLYGIDHEMQTTMKDVPRHSVLCDVRDQGHLDRVMAAAAPDIVFHAAALKHVPMVEANVAEGILTNVIGSRNTADACIKAGVPMMVQISTDKAVNPTNVMGATKRLAESYCQSLDIISGTKQKGGKATTRFVTVRFGNVLGSTGSVVPLFAKQLAQGGPLTVTHAQMTRYFMSVREAVELVLQAAALAKQETRQDNGDGTKAEGKIFVLDMGEPVRILDLAHQVIRLAGLTPGEDIAIEITGPRPGEKLHEELFHDSESLVSTAIDGIHLAAPRTADHGVLERALSELEDVARKGDEESLLDLLTRLVPEYRPEDALDGKGATRSIAATTRQTTRQTTRPSASQS